MHVFDRRRFTFGVVLSLTGAVALSYLGMVPGWLIPALAWFGLAFLFVGLAYLAGQPRWMGKRDDGTQRWALVAVAGPWLGLVWLSWRLRRIHEREAAWHEIGPGLFLGRRCTPAELPPSVSHVVDVTSELPSTSGSFTRTVMPILDGCAPPVVQLSSLIEGLSDAQGNVFVHCMAGYGRSAMVAAALLLSRGIVATPEEAVRHLKRIRRGIRLGPGQRATLEAWHAMRLRAASAPLEPRHDVGQ